MKPSKPMRTLWLTASALFLFCLLRSGAAPSAADVLPVSGTVPQKLVALTFDDGPRRSTTTALLDGLAQRGVKATFFLIGRQIPGNEDLIRRMDAEGHQIGIHTYDHTILTGLNEADFQAQVEVTRTLLTQLLGHNGFLLRPPYGMVDDGVKAMAGAPIILWSVDPEDWREQGADLVSQHLISQAKDGDILLLHDIFPGSVEAALETVDALMDQGFYFVTVEELFSLRHISLENGCVYRCAYP
ncbi:polysaccharide deacetylase family protein [Pseudoflavonifractor phocaeensis]|uniref:polysaccharide deacetylase family protein n=1 Tax=Pseudoflavonifractor phocaeensis TaxID=1870988 RepID=UPI00195C587D|nr:polysaccharide deacetylase family protein [Pseudoflavonifractor phocaeensis]MBM6871602.1 polysaccharide deacetylase family protein [Pseudoflavonifractor phocaeensis]MBM6939513.1 polysaccharide deacetylase family protein [Pseudoflavonifractor phocaeensis]